MTYRPGQAVVYTVDCWAGSGTPTYVGYHGTVLRSTRGKVYVSIPEYSTRTQALDKNDPALSPR